MGSLVRVNGRSRVSGDDKAGPTSCVPSEQAGPHLLGLPISLQEWELTTSQESWEPYLPFLTNRPATLLHTPQVPRSLQNIPEPTASSLHVAQGIVLMGGLVI
jgi:hypothetical protein